MKDFKRDPIRLNLNASMKLKKVEDGEEQGNLKVTGMASTNTQDRHGDIIAAGAWTNGLEAYKRNPILLFNHKYDCVIGKVTSVKPTDMGLEVDAEIDRELAPDVARMVEKGYVNTFSVGLMAKDVEYVREMDGFVIKEVDLFELSVVSVPANSDAVFSVSKQLDSKTLSQLKKGEELLTEKDAGGEQGSQKGRINMNEKELAALVAAAVKEANREESTQKALEAKEKAEAERLEAEKAAEKTEMVGAVAKTVAVTVTENCKGLIDEVEQRLDAKFAAGGDVDVSKAIEGLQADLAAYGDKLHEMTRTERAFAAKRDNATWQKAFEKDIVEAHLFAHALAGKNSVPKWETNVAKSLIEKVNAHSGIEVSSADFEQVVSTSIYEDIQNELVLAPLFDEVALTSASQIVPILPDAGYAQFTANQTGSGSNPKGNLEKRGDTYGSPYGGIGLQERTLSTKKLISKTYLGNETGEDAILPILPLLRKSVIRSHARSTEAAILVGNSADGPFGTGGDSFNGLVTLAAADGHKTQSAGTLATDALTATALLGARKNLGKYGVRQANMFYIVSQRAWYELIEDPEFQDTNLVGDQASKIRGEVGRVYGSPVIMCDEFADPDVNKFYALAFNPSMFVMPRLRGVTVESDYETADQRTVLVASQRIGLTDMIQGSTAKWALQYAAT